MSLVAWADELDGGSAADAVLHVALNSALGLLAIATHSGLALVDIAQVCVCMRKGCYSLCTYTYTVAPIIVSNLGIWTRSSYP